MPGVQQLQSNVQEKLFGRISPVCFTFPHQESYKWESIISENMFRANKAGVGHLLNTYLKDKKSLNYIHTVRATYAPYHLWYRVRSVCLKTCEVEC